MSDACHVELQVQQQQAKGQSGLQKREKGADRLRQASTAAHEAFDVLATEDDDSLCVICMEWPQTQVLAPCSHCVTCEACTERVLKSPSPLCPYCRTAIESHFTVAFV